jgi:cyclomaltodextrinase / maltogenic alpha-amylase / neopullulanase
LADWARDAIFYHVYPLGLCGAPARNDFGAAPVERLDKLVPWFGHIRDLGCDALYLGPLFESTAHGYDTADYWHLDRRLGTDETLCRVIAAAHAAGLRVVLDGVFNHVGRDFWAFRDVQSNGEASPFRDWFAGLRFDARSPYGDPFTYQGWHGHFDLVTLNLDNPDVRGHLFGAVESWIRDFEIDGLRLDAADVIDLGFQRDLASMTRGLDPDFWLFGEVVHGDYRRWANPDTLDSVTNYEAYKGLYSSLVDRNYFEIAYTLNREFGPRGLYTGLPLFNFVDNHDQDRVATKLGDNRLLYPLYLLLFTMPGVPSIYYGSEWGLTGKLLPGDDSPVRPELDLAAAPGLGSEPALVDTIRRVARLRCESGPLLGGSYRQLHVAAEQFGFARELDGETVVVLLNASDHAVEMSVDMARPAGSAGSAGSEAGPGPWPQNGEWRDLLNGGTVTATGGLIRCEVPAGWGRVLAASGAAAT